MASLSLNDLLARGSYRASDPFKRRYNDIGTTHRRQDIGDNWSQLFGELIKKRGDEHDIQVRSKRIRLRREVIQDTGWEAEECVGDRRLRNIYKLLLVDLGIKPSPDQLLFLNSFIESCLPKIYGAEWPDHQVRVMDEFGLKKIEYETMIITARRYGKTWSVSMFVLAILLCVPGISICIFSTGSRASSGLYDILMNMLTSLPDAFERVVKNTKENLFIAATLLPKGSSMNSAAASKMKAAKDTSKLYAFPDTVKGIV